MQILEEKIHIRLLAAMFSGKRQQYRYPAETQEQDRVKRIDGQLQSVKSRETAFFRDFPDSILKAKFLYVG
jgi:hypothetical protein